MAHETSLYAFLEHWQSTCLFDYQLTFTEAIESLKPKSNKRLVEARTTTSGKSTIWTLFDTRTNQEAILVHAAVWHSNTSFDTGNFVPPGETPSNQIPDARVQRTVGFKCDISYTIDTTVEDSFYANLEILEEYIQTVKGFNRENRERSTWQNGSHRETYSMTSKLFVRKAPNVKEPKFQPHEWLIRGMKAQKRREHVINPERPMYFDLVNDKVARLANSKPPKYRNGDIVWFSFKVSFYVASQYWSSDVTPIEFIRVARGRKFGLNDDSDDDGEPSQKKHLEEGAPLAAISRKSQTSENHKRKADSQSDGEKTASSDGEPSGSAASDNISIKPEIQQTEAPPHDDDQVQARKKTKKIKT